MSSARRVLAFAALSLATAPAAASAQSFIDWTDEAYAAIRSGYTFGALDGTTSLLGVGIDFDADEASIEFSTALGARFLNYGVVELEGLFSVDADKSLETQLTRSGRRFFGNISKRNGHFGALLNFGGAYKFDRLRVSALGGIGFGHRSMTLKLGSSEIEGDADSGLLYQGRLAAGVDLADRWSVETSAAYRYETEREFRDFRSTLGDFNIKTDARGVGNFSVGLVYRFGGGDRGDRPAPAADGFVRPASFDGFPPAAQARRAVDAPLTADQGLSAAVAPTPRTAAELDALRDRLAALEARADEIAVAKSPVDAGESAAAQNFGLDTPFATPAPFAADDASPPRAPLAFMSTMAELADQMRAITRDMTGAPAPADPFFSSLAPAGGPIPAASPAGLRADHYVAVTQSADSSDAEAAWAAANAQYPDLLSGLPAAVEDWAPGGPRIHAGPTTPEEAARICGAIRARGGRCGVASAAALGFEDAARSVTNS